MPKFTQFSFAAVLALLLGATFPAVSFAAGESSAILAVFSEYKVEALLIAVGFAVILWAIRAVSLLKPKS